MSQQSVEPYLTRREPVNAANDNVRGILLQRGLERDWKLLGALEAYYDARFKHQPVDHSIGDMKVPKASNDNGSFALSHKMNQQLLKALKKTYLDPESPEKTQLPGKMLAFIQSLDESQLKYFISGAYYDRERTSYRGRERADTSIAL